MEQEKKDGIFVIGLENLQTITLLMSSHFPKKLSVALLLSLFLFLFLPPTWVGSVDDYKVELVSFSSVGAVMDLVFLALD